MVLDSDVKKGNDLREVKSIEKLATLHGLVLAGGSSIRMGCDKGLIKYHGVPQVLWLHSFLSEFCESVYVSIKPKQQNIYPYSELPLIIDSSELRGPAAGMLAAWDFCSGCAWLVVAIDLPFLKYKFIKNLIDMRDQNSLAVAYQHSSGVLEPVCTIYEPPAHHRLIKNSSVGNASLRQILEVGPTVKIPIPEQSVFRSINTFQEYEKACKKF